MSAAPETRMTAHELRRIGRTQPRPVKVRGAVLRTAIEWAAQPWPWCLIGPEFREEIEAIELAIGGALNAPLEPLP